MNRALDVTFEVERGVLELGGRRIVAHCNHYNAILQRTIEDGLKERAPRLLTAAGTEAARRFLEGLERQAPTNSSRECLERAVQVFAEHGFGAFDISKLSEWGGTVTMARSHYAIGWRARCGVRSTPGCFFPAGYLAGALAVAAKLAPERVTTTETACYAAGHDHCVFVVEVW